MEDVDVERERARSDFLSTAKQAYQLAGLAEAWLSKPRRYAFETKYALEHLDDEEDLQDLFVASYDKGVFDGLLVVTDVRLLFVRFRWLWRRPFVRSIRFDEIDDMCEISMDGTPAVQVDLGSGGSITLRSTEEHADRIGELVSRHWTPSARRGSD